MSRSSRGAEPVSRRERPAKPALTRAGIVAAALEVLEKDGLEGLTMRRLAQDLDTAPGSLYVYFANREQLLASIYDAVLGELALPDTRGPSDRWREDLTELLLATVAVLGRRGGIARVALGAIPTGPHALALAETILALLTHGQVGGQAAAWAVDQLMLWVNAAALEESTYRQQGQREHLVVDNLRITYAELRADQYPNVHRMQQELVTGSGEQRARWFIDTMISGMLVSQDVPDPAQP